MEYAKELEFAKKIAGEAGLIMQKYYRADQQVEMKSDHTPVTIADKAVNQLVINRVKVEFPNYGVLGEELSYESEREKLWVCDPIDGTVGYIIHVPTSMFSLALVMDGIPQVAVAFNPWTGELYSAIKGQGAFRDRQPIKVSSKPWGAGVHIAGSSSGKDEPADKARQELLKERIYVAGFIGTVFKGCLIAEGSIEGRTYMHRGAHDLAAVALLIKEAGGKVTDLNGNEQRYDRPINGAVMSNGLIHEQLLELVKANT